ncbi:MAG: cryptochrome/photolyase family protein, partial [Chlamydiota bacterium]
EKMTTLKNSYSTIALVLSDQLDHAISSLKCVDPATDLVVMMEVYEEATYVKHHPKKIAFLFSAMRHFANELVQKGFTVLYYKLDCKKNHQSLTKNIEALTQKYEPERLFITEPGEYRVLEFLKKWQKELSCEVYILPDDRFFCDHETFENWVTGKKSLVMEHFYRMMRKDTGYLMESDGKPTGGNWNYDQDNRNKYDGKTEIIGPKTFQPDAITLEVIALVEKEFNSHFGSTTPFWFGVTAKEARLSLNHFIKHSLPHFGTYQDAMVENEHFLFHSVLSQYINCGLLSPRLVCEEVIKAYKNNHAPINAVEGFIRQIIGWREYIRGLYWHLMPEYTNMNHLKAKRPLPKMYWTGETDMKCMRHVIQQTKEEAHSHHIQRLMITGNFALLAGILPEEVCDWYLAVYADAFEWVELPNTLSMALFADGGILATKPYAASGNYINKMSNFCKGCPYNVKKRLGEDACPFNYLYWNFLEENKKLLESNQRLRFAYANLKKIPADELKAIKKQSEEFLSSNTILD